MSKGLEVLTKLKNIDWFCPKNHKDTLYTFYKNDFDVIETALKKLKRWENLKISEEEAQWLMTLINNPESQLNKLKAFDLLVKKLDMETLLHWLKEHSTEEEFNLLKEVLL